MIINNSFFINIPVRDIAILGEKGALACVERGLDTSKSNNTDWPSCWLIQSHRLLQASSVG